ncbi:hypothetical protein AGOEGFPJ_00069 [Human alphaherpesvirus 3]
MAMGDSGAGDLRLGCLYNTEKKGGARVFFFITSNRF